MTEAEIKHDRYMKFRGLGHSREFVVTGGAWEKADADRAAAEGVKSKSGRWAQVSVTTLSGFLE